MVSTAKGTYRECVTSDEREQLKKVQYAESNCVESTIGTLLILMNEVTYAIQRAQGKVDQVYDKLSYVLGSSSSKEQCANCLAVAAEDSSCRMAGDLEEFIRGINLISEKLKDIYERVEL